MTRERRDNGFVSSFESVAVLRFEEFGKFFYENLRLDHLKQKKKSLHMPPACLLTLNAEVVSGRCKRLNAEHQEEET